MGNRRSTSISVILGIAVSMSLVNSRADDVPPMSAAETGIETVVFLAPGSPLFLRVRVLVDGDDVHTWLGRFVYDSLDTDKDGSLKPEEFAKLPQGIISGIDPSAGAQAIDEADVSPADGVLSRDEFVGFVASRMANTFGVLATPQRTTSVVRLLSRLDRNNDGLLSEPEVADAASTLSKRDFDDDGTLSAAELLPFRDPLAAAQAPTDTAPTELPFIRIERGRPDAEIVDRILNQYGTTNGSDDARRIPSDRMELDQETFKQFDVNDDDIWNRDELLAFVSQPVHQLALDLEFSSRSRPKMSARWLQSVRPHKQMEYESGREDRVALNMNGLAIQVRALGGFRTAALDNRSFFLINFRRADQDKNGYLEPAELPAVGAGTDFAAIDENGDGMIFREELASYIDRQALVDRTRILLHVARDGRSLFEMLDQNRDLRLSPRELRAGFENLRSIDQDEDGQIAPSEFSESYTLRFELGKPAQFSVSGMVQAQQEAQMDARIPQTDQLSGPLWFRRMDRNRDGDVAPREFLGTSEQFAQVDADGDGLINADEANSIGSRPTGNTD